MVKPKVLQHHALHFHRITRLDTLVDHCLASKLDYVTFQICNIPQLISHIQEVKSALRDPQSSKVTSRTRKRPKKPLMKKDGSNQAMSVLCIQMDLSALLIAQKISSNLPKANILHQKSLRMSTFNHPILLKFLFMVNLSSVLLSD